MGKGAFVRWPGTFASGSPGWPLANSRCFFMNPKILAGLLSLLAASAFAVNENNCAVIPLPQKVERHEGVFVLQPTTSIFVDADEGASVMRSEEHTSELQSLRHLV